MKNDKLFIPTTCKVGFQARSDTYTGKLGYIIAFDGKKWRKEPSWRGWCTAYASDAEIEEIKVSKFEEFKKRYGYANYTYDQWISSYYRSSNCSTDESFKPIEFSNVPTAGFTLNKDVRRDGYWGNGHNMIRVYDPRGFEFEISVINLLFILMYVDCNSRELMGEMVYSWNGKDLVLLPVGTQEYQSSIQHTADQHKKVSAKDLVPGLYKTKQGVVVKYLGKFRVFENNSYNKSCTTLEKQHVFVLPEETYTVRNSWRLGKSIYQYGKSLAFLSHYVSENVDHAEDVEAFLASKFNYQVDYDKPIYEVQTDVVPVLNYSFSLRELKDFRFAKKVNPVSNKWNGSTNVAGNEGLTFENVYVDAYPRDQNDPTSYYYNYNQAGIEFMANNYEVFYNGYKFQKALIKEGRVYLQKTYYYGNNWDTSIEVDHNEFIHNIVIQKLVGYETTNGKIHNV